MRGVLQVPREVQTLVKAFYPRSEDRYATPEEWIAGTLANFFNNDEREVIRRFLDELLSVRYSDEEIQEVWQRQYPSYDFSAGGHRVFFTMIREALGP